jgi:hypothetical protein
LSHKKDEQHTLMGVLNATTMTDENTVVLQCGL